MPSHTLCSQEYEDEDASPWIPDILWLHYRSQLALGHLSDFPATGNMLEMRWDDELAKVAQALAERCFTPEGFGSHDHPEDRTTLTFCKVSQNLFSQRDSFEAKVAVKCYSFVQDLFDENYLYSSSKVEKYEAVNVLYPEGAFRMFIYVCNYAPAGNVIDQELYWPGPPSSFCPEDTKCNQTRGLCSVTGVEPGADKTTTTTTKEAPPTTEPDDHPPSHSPPEAVAEMSALAAALTAVGAWRRRVA
ncbi:cysteine-rich venom protein-like [Amblyomma americanum]